MDPILVTFVLVLGAVMLAQVSANWHSGVFFIVGVGFLQDVVRKLVPGEPVGISATVAVVMLFVWGMGLNRFGGYGEEMSLGRHYPSIFRSFAVFTGLVFFQSIVTIVNYGSIPLAAIGLIAYLSPLPAIWIGWWFCRTEKDLLHLLLAYAAFGIVVALGLYLSWLGTDWVILNHIGEPLVIYDEVYGVVETYSGFMRAPDVAAWHLGAASCFLIALAATRPTLARIVVFSLAIALIIPAIYLTGRRKALGMIGLFVGILTILLQFSRSRDTRKAIVALVGLVVCTLGMLSYLSEDASEASGFRVYADRGETVYGDAWERFYLLGVGSVGWAINRVGFFGVGVGVVSQGGQHFGADAQFAGAAEGGLGKIIVELGIPGLIVLTWVLLVVGNSIRKALALADRSGGAFSTARLALVAFLLVNVFVFITASQIFGDPFVLILLGIVLGALLTASRVRDRQRKSDINVLRPRGSVGGFRTRSRELPS